MNIFPSGTTLPILPDETVLPASASITLDGAGAGTGTLAGSLPYGARAVVQVQTSDIISNLAVVRANGSAIPAGWAPLGVGGFILPPDGAPLPMRSTVGQGDSLSVDITGGTPAATIQVTAWVAIRNPNCQ